MNIQRIEIDWFYIGVKYEPSANIGGKLSEII
jgi:hypothetical protein